MKRHIFIMAVIFMIAASVAAQEVKKDKVSDKDQKNKKEQVGDKTKKANHGQAVNQVSRGTESGPGKGEIVSDKAQTHGKKKDHNKTKSSSAVNKNGTKGKGAHGNHPQYQVAGVPGHKGPGQR